MVGISNADIRRRIGCDIGYDIVVNLAVIRIQAQIDGDVRI